MLNRIVESPVESLEKDLLQIATGNAYTPQYPALNFWITQRGSKTKMLSQRRLSQLAAIYKPLAKNAFEFNAYASVLMAAKQWAAAENVLLINSLLYPAEPRVWQSLAALYTQTGDASKLRQCNKTLATLKPL
ncbi:MAG: hypothetical protein EAY75_12155 [Bacteroidetes bacterium]|nr:MAG: hypothetical protein EAY75_12155 [Bacteroidota bacterium]